ncbi:MAG: type II toxin-antitoxin system VapB family antitoxin [Chthoniobacterales bacterium]|nr:type II toxin-antitoxin system VapB family antitoxin [Chthoniobacterales bacterium]
MKTTVDIPDKTLREAMKFAKAKTKREAILAALEEFNRKRRIAALVKHSGTFTTLMTNDEIEGMEIKRMKLWGKATVSRTYKP